MTDTQIVNWIEENLVSIRERMDEKIEVYYIKLNGAKDFVVGDSLRDCVEKAAVQQ